VAGIAGRSDLVVSTAEHRRILDELSDAIAAGRPVVLATIVSTKRSVPRHAGTKMLVYDGAEQTGTVGGGELEARVMADALDVLGSGRTRLETYVLLDPDQGDPGVCGGELTVYLEPYMPPHTVFVVGAGHVGASVVDLAHWLGYRTVASDDRAERVKEDVVPNADERIVGSVAEALASVPVTDTTSVVVVSRSVDLDVEAIPLLLDTPAAYIGVMGSARRWSTTRRRLLENGIEEVALQRIHVPIGIEIGAETVEEIAVSILSEIIRETRAAPGTE
jgi:xanthine dehydrogenase accessory factor